MRVNLLKTLLITSCILAYVNIMDCRAQEIGSPSFESYDSEPLREREFIFSSAGEPSELAKLPVTLRFRKDKDSTNLPPSAPQQPKNGVTIPDSASVKTQVQTQNKKQEDSLLNFNFLYYLIEKYKLQDIVD